ncbi:chitooligosaccharidolytic beta-N-acetylglucosaminidase-like [Eupeodes corollae]|uniref:chitooligosaccharidolytic beta-N-acetylglucosaminidase-like n=1 Tax=Eupeodes corollae TaxID=290404 RepID=UPI002491C3F2|nr:chitooligosaccharidolytic beta-N-acetylglucosaminidase-like [Eupeodes corollae]
MAGNKFFKLVLCLTTAFGPAWASAINYDVVESSPVWGYECNDNKNCIKVPFKNEYISQSFVVCRMLCGDEDIGTLWPKPSGPVEMGEVVVSIDRTKIRFQLIPKFVKNYLWDMAKERFAKQIEAKIPDSSLVRNDGKSLMIRINLEEIGEDIYKLSYETDESYVLKITEAKDQVLVEIEARTYFGARHGLETLAQLIVYDDIGRCMEILVDTEIHDAPVYKHRGLLLDTARHYFSLKSIKRTLDGMAMSKLNVFHWHIVDSNSFPLVVRSHPDLHKYGAYSTQKIYTPQNIREVVEYALIRGIRVIPELGGPAHIGEGWQKQNVTVCFNAQPWTKFCTQPPCGQLDPTIDRVYDLLEDIYAEMFKSFNPNIFHMGGDSVSLNCWNSSQSIQNWMRSRGMSLEVKDFVKLWTHFQTNALARLDKASQESKIPIILWASKLTTPPYIDEDLDKSRYIIQTVANTPEEFIQEALKRGFRFISTNFDLFINSETANWNTGNDGDVNLDGWRKFYENKPDRISGGPNKLILGSEAAVWSEQIDEFTLDSQLWPKASALAERLWSNPKESWRKAEDRLLMHREFLAQNGLTPEALQPEWCVQNQNNCP